MKKLQLNILVAIAIFSVAVLSSCQFDCVKGSGHQASETRKVTDFEKIDISGGFKVNLKQDSSLTLNITADDNLLKYIKTSVEGGTLHIKTERNLCNSSLITVNIGIGKLNELESSGAVEVTADSTIHTSDLVFRLSGATKVTMTLDAANVTTKSSGATELYLKGQASTSHVDISGVGKVYAYDFVVGDYYIETSGASNCELNALHSIEVHSSGASDIKYKGNPSSVTNDKSGASSLEKVN